MDDETRAKIYDHYQKGQGSIQDIARVYHCSVQEVLDIIGQGDLSRIEIPGDLIDASEAGPNASMNYGKVETITFTTD